MGRRYGDLLPQASGRTHLGVEEGVVVDSFSNIVPFGMVHMESGVLHHAGASGLLRFNHHANVGEARSPCIEVSVNGGLTYDCLVPSGGIRQMIDVYGGGGGGGGGDQDMQSTFDFGNEIDIPVVPNVGSTFDNSQYRGVVLRETSPGVHPFTGIENDFAIMASGDAGILDPNSENSHYSTLIRSAGIICRGSGALDRQAATISFGFTSAVASDTGVFGCDAAFQMFALSGLSTLIFGGPVSTTIFGAQDYSIIGAGAYTVAANDDMSISSTNGPWSIISASNDFTDECLLRGDQGIRFAVLSNSGQMRYHLGPHEAWFTSPSHTTDYFPIAHSGQVNQMILEQTVDRCHTQSFVSGKSWPITHNLGTQNVLVSVRDNDGNIVYPDEVVVNNGNSVTLDWAFSQGGTVVVRACD